LVKLSADLDKKGLDAIREEHLPGGKHRIVVTEFPEWVPAEVVARSKRLTKQEARSMLTQAMIP
jgi:hypothetical protein